MSTPELEPDSTVVRLEAVSRSFGTVVALDRVDLSVRRGGIYGIIGRSGAGKSTLIRTLNGLERADTGRVLIEGQDIATLDERALRALRRRVGMIFQHFNLLSAKTVHENVELPLKLAGRPAAERTAAVRRMLELVGLQDKAELYPARLSGGQKQRIGIARALVAGPRLLLSDEATSALDPETTLSILELLKEVNRTLGVTIVLITHEMTVIREICDDVAVLDHGRIIESGPVWRVFRSPQTDLTRRLLRTVRPALPDALARLLSEVPIPGGRLLLRIASPDADRYEGILASLARDSAWQAQIVHAELDQVQARQVGSVTFSLRERGREALSQLRTTLAGFDADVEELGYVAG